MTIQRVTGMLGLCARAGLMKTGEQASEQLVKRGGAQLLLYDEGISERSEKGLRDACRYAGVAMMPLPQGVLGDAIGKPGRMAAAIVDRKFAERIRALLAPDDKS